MARPPAAADACPPLLPFRVHCRHLSGLAQGVRPGYGLLDGAACEFVLGLLITFIVLVCNELKSRWVLGTWGCGGWGMAGSTC